ncbi:MAG: DMT family transporter [Candidatus Bathyarchaeota archaeon]|nr:DMT family transporter [Candidatus Bathyarchaeota archaeon]MDH5746073.1 DMT family transporter [Candidatus Bathyarchaeota archaeon]
MHMRTRKLALTEGITAGVLFGTAAIFIRFLQNLDAFSIAFWRLIIACLILAIILIVLGKSFNSNLVRKNLKELLILSIFLALHFIFFISAVKDTTILNATVLVNTTPIFSIFVSSFLFHLKPSRLAIVGLTISFVGVCVIAYAETIIVDINAYPENFSPSLKGDLEAVLAALVEAFYLNYGRKIRKQMAILPTMFPMYMLTATIVGVLGISATNKILTLPTEAEIILPLVGLGILPTAAAHTLYFSSLLNLKSFETATMALLEPMGATVLGIIFFQEIPAPMFVFGAVLILLGIFFIAKEKS